MPDKLFKLALIWSLIGIFLLILVANFYEPNLINIEQIPENVGKIVKVKGILTKVNYYESVNIFELEDKTSSIKVVMFENPDKKINNGDQIQVKGKATLYKGDLEIIADEIVCIRCQE